ncbi:hypothetical protein PR001_g241 [Phytophthora rubi]|uniref:DUF2723 domain-containing protein n=1 Tax=Phytophthora rubi TaxID=129364 RepID=A0A6A3NYY0_9STRA|nr:hypothetical protein PR002_g472 [Phytophthora rubi]KAE9052750.1 hypothetical protein PR001_g241 [Phytophthora rubi]
MPSPWLWTLLLSQLIYTTVWPLDRLPGGDSGELLAEACVGGVAHPPGYPLLLSMLRLVRWAAQQCGYNTIAGDETSSVHFVLLANAMNAFVAAGAAACVTHTVHLLTSRSSSVEAIAAGLCFALSKLTWEYARGIEVFALNNFLVGVLHILVVRHFMQPTMKNACMGAFVCGLGLTNQHTIVLFEVPFILWVLLTRRFCVVELMLVAATFVAGLSIYLQTILSAQEPTPGTWGDTSTLTGLFAHVRRKEYGTLRLSPLQGDSEGLLARLAAYIMDCLDDFHWTGLMLMALGVRTRLFPNIGNNSKLQQEGTLLRGYVGLAQMSALVCYLVVFHSLANLPLDSPMPRAVSSRFNMQPNTILAVWLGLGLAEAAPRIASAVTLDMKWAKVIRFSFCLTLVATQYQRNQPVGDVYSAGDMIRKHGEDIFHVIPRSAVLLSYTDINWNSLRYLQACENVRPDVTLLSLQLLPFPWFTRQQKLYPDIIFPPIRHDASTVKSSRGYAQLLHNFLAANMGKHGDHLFLDLHAVNDEDIASNGQYLGFKLTPNGLVWKVSLPPPSVADRDILYSRWKTILPSAVQFAPSLYPAGSWEFAAATIANDARYQGGLFALSYWIERGRAVQHVSEAAKFVLGMRHALQLLTQVEANAAVADGSWGLTYEIYDLLKNTALAAMRFTSGLELMESLINPLKDHQQRNGASRQDKIELQTLQKSLQHLDETRQGAVARIDALLPDMKSRQDPDAKAFENFVEVQRIKSKNKKKKKKKSKMKEIKNNSHT